MKKLIIAAVAICTAIFANAAAANWKASAKDMCNGTGSDTAYFSGTAYLFDAGVTSQAALFAMLEGGSSIGTSTAGYVATATFDSDGYFGNLAFSNGEQGGGTYTYYFVVVDGDNAYFSNEKALAANASATPKSIAFGSQSGSSALPVAGFQGAGAWSAVPEPTSGLLMLLGMAGLALRRRRA